MPVTAIVGAQWGDEGKGKIVDLLSENADYIVRYGGGNNAGHTVMNAYGEFKLHMVPAGVFNPSATCVLANGVVVHPPSLLEEMRTLERHGVDLTPGQRLLISDRAHLIMPYHLLLDELEEKGRGSKAIGTTKKGIGPAYMDKTGRLGIRVGDLLDPEAFRQRLEQVLDPEERPALQALRRRTVVCGRGFRRVPRLRRRAATLRRPDRDNHPPRRRERGHGDHGRGPGRTAGQRLRDIPLRNFLSAHSCRARRWVRASARDS